MSSISSVSVPETEADETGEKGLFILHGYFQAEEVNMVQTLNWTAPPLGLGTLLSRPELTYP